MHTAGCEGHPWHTQDPNSQHHLFASFFSQSTPRTSAHKSRGGSSVMCHHILPLMLRPNNSSSIWLVKIKSPMFFPLLNFAVIKVCPIRELKHEQKLHLNAPKKPKHLKPFEEAITSDILLRIPHISWETFRCSVRLLFRGRLWICLHHFRFTLSKKSMGSNSASKHSL